jgi:hypothetical protein
VCVCVCKGNLILRHAGGTFCDLDKAFDCVNHKILSAKLHLYDILGILFEPLVLWIQLNDQCVLQTGHMRQAVHSIGLAHGIISVHMKCSYQILNYPIHNHSWQGQVVRKWSDFTVEWWVWVAWCIMGSRCYNFRSARARQFGSEEIEQLHLNEEWIMYFMMGKIDWFTKVIAYVSQWTSQFLKLPLPGNAFIWGQCVCAHVHRLWNQHVQKNWIPENDNNLFSL